MVGFGDGLILWRLDIEELTDTGEVLGTTCVGKKAVVSDAVGGTVGQDVEQEAADEFGAVEGHDLLSVTAFGAVSPSIRR